MENDSWLYESGVGILPAILIKFLNPEVAVIKIDGCEETSNVSTHNLWLSSYFNYKHFQ